VLVGPNGSGKTSVLEALRIQSELAAGAQASVLTEDRTFEDLLRRGAKGPIGLTSKGTRSDADWTSRMELTEGSMDFFWEQGVDVRKIKVGAGKPLRDGAREIGNFLGQATLYKLNPATIAAAAYSDQTTPDVEPDGTNTAAALAAIKLGHDEEFERIEASLRRVIPSLSRVRIRPVLVPRRNMPGNAESVMGSKVFFDFMGTPGVPAHAAGEGALVALALLTILHSPNRPKLLLLDQLAQDLHPLGQVELVRMIKDILGSFNDVQIVATTHAPRVLDELNPSQVQAFALREDGTVATKSLAQHPRATKMKSAVTAGQLWSLDPERDWVLAGTTP
jgi:predicted ATPase